MKQTVKFQRASIFRRICSSIFDGIIMILLLMVTQSYVFMPIVIASTDYNARYDQYVEQCVDSKLYVREDDNKPYELKTIYKNEQFEVFYKDNNIGLTIDDYNKSRAEQKVTINNQEYNLFKLNETNMYIEYKLDNIDANKTINDGLDEGRNKYYYSLSVELINKYSEHENNKLFKDNASYLSGLIMSSYIYALLFALCFTFLLFPMIFKDRATLGKKMFQLSVISLKDAEIASRVQILIRFVCFTAICIVLGIMTFGLSILISLCFIPINSKHQTIHDLVSRTAVVNTSINTESEKEIFGFEVDDEKMENNDVIDAEITNEQTILEENSDNE